MCKYMSVIILTGVLINCRLLGMMHMTDRSIDDGNSSVRTSFPKTSPNYPSRIVACLKKLPLIYSQRGIDEIDLREIEALITEQVNLSLSKRDDQHVHSPEYFGTDHDY